MKPMSSSPRRSVRTALASLLVLACVEVGSTREVAAQQLPSAPVSAVPRVQQAPPSLMRKFDAARGTLQELAVPLGLVPEARVAVQLGGTVRQLHLHPHDVRSHDFRLLVVDAAGTHEVPAGPAVTWRGTVDGDSRTAVAAALVGGSMRALVRMPEGEGCWVVQPVHEVEPTAGNMLHVVYHHSDTANMPWQCGTVAPTTGVPQGPVAGTDVNLECQISCEADYFYYQRNNSSVSATQADITQVVNAMDVIYRTDVQIAYVVPTIVVWTTTDPYTSTDPATLLGQFQTQWNVNRGSVVRDVAHLFTGRNLAGSTIGVAFLGTVCYTGAAYGLSESLFTANFGSRVGLTSHEVGHNWNATHCDAVTDCRIMCSGLGGCTGVLNSFSPTERAQIDAYKQSVTCLTQQLSVPVATNLTPMSVKSFNPQLVTVNGSGFSGTTAIQVGGVPISTGFTVLSDTQIRFTPPAPTALGTVPIRVVNALGTSNQLALTYTGTTPSELSVPLAAIGGSSLNFQFGGSGGGLWFLLVSLANTTAPLQGQPVLTGYSVLAAGALNAVGVGSHSVAIPPGILNGITVYSQVLDVAPATLTLTSASNLGTTRFFF